MKLIRAIIRLICISPLVLATACAVPITHQRQIRAISSAIADQCRMRVAKSCRSSVVTDTVNAALGVNRTHVACTEARKWCAESIPCLRSSADAIGAWQRAAGEIVAHSDHEVEAVAIATATEISARKICEVLR